MNNDTRRASGLTRSSSALGAAVLLLGGLALGACSKTDTSGTAASAIGSGQVQQQVVGSSAADSDTVDLVDAALTTPASQGGAKATKGDRKGLRSQLLRGVHGTWVTVGKAGPVTHQAIRGDVTAVSATSVTIKAKDGFSQTYTVSGDTKVRARAAGKGADSTIGAVKVGSKAFVAGVGATAPTARIVIFRSATSKPSGSPAPSATS